jgi:hypothetical protein
MSQRSWMEPPLEFARCRLCRRLIALCSHCRTRATCSPECAREHRRQQVLEAGRRYQATPDGAAAHAERQRRYRMRQRECVTHPTRQQSGSVMAQTSSSEDDSGPIVRPGNPAAEWTTRSSPDGRISLYRCAYCRRVTSQWHRILPTGRRRRRPVQRALGRPPASPRIPPSSVLLPSVRLA